MSEDVTADTRAQNVGTFRISTSFSAEPCFVKIPVVCVHAGMVMLTPFLAALFGMQLASECGVLDDRCGYDDNGKPVRIPLMDRGHPSITFHPEDHAHECCDGLMCEDGICRRSSGAAAPSASDLKAVYDKWAPGNGISLERASQMIMAWKGREERLLTSVRLKHSSAQPKDEV